MGVRKSVPFSKKCEIARCLRKGVSIGSLSRRYDLSKLQFSVVKRRSGLVVHFVRKAEFLRRTNTPKTEEALYKWLLSQTETDAIITTVSLYKEAQRINDELKELGDFKITMAWVNYFKQRHRITTNKMKPEEFPRKKEPAIADNAYYPEQIYRADQIVLFWRVLPAKSTQKTSMEVKSHVECLTFLCCTNVNGSHKLNPLIIGSASDVDIGNSFDTSVIYKSTEDAQLTPELFREWFNSHFVEEALRSLQERQLETRGILLLDNSICRHPPAHELVSQGGEIKTMLIPATKALDRNMADLARFEYKKRLLTDVLANSMKPITLCDAISNLRRAWNAVPVSAIESCWKKIMHDDEHYSVEDYTPLPELRAELAEEKQNHSEIRELVNCLDGGVQIPDNEVSSWLQSDSGAIHSNKDPEEEKEEDEEDERAKACLEILLDWATEYETESETNRKIYDMIDLALKNNFDEPQECTSTTED